MQGGGPSAESWMRDVNELGMNVKLDVKPRRDDDNINEFKDLFSTAMNKDWNTSAPKRTVDLSYNPGVAPGQQQQAAPMQAMPQPVSQPAPAQQVFAPPQPAPAMAAANPFDAQPMPQVS